MYVYIHIHTYIHIYIYIYVCMYTHIYSYVCMYVCMYIYIYIYCACKLQSFLSTVLEAPVPERSFRQQTSVYVICHEHIFRHATTFARPARTTTAGPRTTSRPRLSASSSLFRRLRRGLTFWGARPRVGFRLRRARHPARLPARAVDAILLIIIIIIIGLYD